MLEVKKSKLDVSEAIGKENEEKIELTEEQKEAIQKLGNAISDVLNTVWDKLKQILEMIIEIIIDEFNTYIMSIEPKTRYKLLKRLGVKNYTSYFKRGK